MAIYNMKYLTEAKVKHDVDNIKSFLRTFYCHSIKWIYQPTRQGKSWADTIIDNSRFISDCLYDKKLKRNNSNVMNKLTDEVLYAAYKLGLTDAKKETRLDIKDINDQIFNEFNSIEIICNENKIKEWMIDNIYDTKYIDYIENK